MNDFSLARIARLARKELRETLRDRRTVITLVLMPILLYPLLGMAFRYFLLADGKGTKPQFRVALESKVATQELIRLLKLSDEDPEVAGVDSGDLTKSLLDDEADIAIRLVNENEMPFNIRNPRSGYQFLILRRDDSANGLRAEEFISGRLARENVALLRERVRVYSRTNDPALPVSASSELIKVAGGKLAYLLPLIPLVLVLMTITGAVYPAIDLTAGERERGTLELLMAAPVPRVALLLAKFIAVMAVTVLTGIINLTMMTLTLLASGLGRELFPGGAPGISTILMVLGLLILFSAFFSAVLLAITSFARSFKEAQAYLIPVMLLALSPGVASLLPGMRLGGLLTITPLLNVVLLARELLEGSVQASVAAGVVVSTLLYAFAAIGIAARLFGAEAVLYSEQGQWGDMFRRPKHSRDAAALTAALLTLALMFPAAFLLNGSLGMFRDLSTPAQMLLLIPINVILFIGFPMVSAYLGRVRPARGFALGMPGPLALTGALLLGLTAWPFVLELIQFQEKIGLSTLPEQVRELAKARVAEWRASPALVLLAMAVIPAAVEELFFRGYLFNAIAAVSRPRTAIVGSAVLFGLFHIMFGGTLSIERLLPSMLMGLLLGWVRWRSGSVWPGVLLHVAHNSFLLSAALFPGLIGPSEEAQHLPTTWYVAGAAGVAVGMILVWVGGRSRKSRPNADLL